MAFKLIIMVAAAITMSVASWLRRESAKRRLADLERGALCILCHKSDMERVGASVRCLSCGHKVTLSFLQSAKLTAGEIAEMARPDDRRL